MQVRTRFAPSPTGFMHVGNFRTGLFAWLVAQNAGGTFILRLEDTDKKREVEGSAEHILECFNSLGIQIDEGFGADGTYGPYRQSERLDIYKKWAQKLLDAGRAYADPYTPEEVQAFREQAQKEKKPFLYRNHRPENPPKWDGTQPLRFKSTQVNRRYNDLVFGNTHCNSEATDDFILIKSDGYPTYNFAHIVDDAEMEITHVIRGQEFLSSMPYYLDLYEALELKEKVPYFAHLPHILNEQGNKKLGKRDGAKDVLDYIREGYLPEALISFIATLGWNDGTEQEVFTTEELIKKFSLDRVGKSGAHFDEKRLNWVNGHFIREMPLDELYNATMGHEQPPTTNESRNFWPPEATNFDEAYKKQVLSVVQERLKYLAELPELTTLFFEEPTPNLELITTNKQLKKLEPVTLKELLTLSLEALEKSDFTPEDIQVRLNTLLQTTNYGPSTIFSIIRIATTWKAFSPQLNETLAVLGKETTIRRLTQSIDYLNN